MAQLRTVSVPGLVVPLLVACTALAPTFAEPGLIIVYGDTAHISAPASASAAVPIQVSVETFAGGCTRAIARTVVTVEGMLAEVHPYNETRRANVCTDDLIILTHTVSVQFDQPGTATIRVIGEQRPYQGSGSSKGPAQLEYHIVVH